MNMELNIVHFYPDLLNLYGDKGNLSALIKRASWRGISANLIACTKEDEIPDFQTADILFLGGGPASAEEMVCGLLKEKREEFRTYLEQDGVLLATCGGFSMLGKEFPATNGMTAGLNVLDFTTEVIEGRYIGNVVIESCLTKMPIVGFENRTGKTLIGDYQPLGKVLCGHGNTGDGAFEGLLYKNVIATHLHGPVLPKNPELCDTILTRALQKKYPEFTDLTPLDDTMENMANEYITATYGK